MPASPCTRPSSLDAGHVVAGRYRVERQIGEGGVGSVYLVRHVHTDELHALKVLQTHALADAGAVERFRKEARVAARIASDHVVRVTDADTAPDLDDAPFLVMELLRGSELTQLVAARGPLPPRLVADILEQAARALDKAHSLGIVHRDLKPDNLFLAERDDGSSCLKVLDFGIARIADAAPGPGQMKTQAGLVFGTPGYMAPEQMTGEPDLVSAATDVWALGLVAYYLLAGSDFFTATSLPQLYALILSGPIGRPSERSPALGAGFDAWFAKAVAREPKDRFQVAGEAAAALSSALGLRASTPPPLLPPLDRISARPAVAVAPPPAVAAVSVDAPGTITDYGPPPHLLAGDRRRVVAGAGLAALVVAGLTTFALRTGSPRDVVAASAASVTPHATSSAGLVPFAPLASAQPPPSAAPVDAGEPVSPASGAVPRDNAPVRAWAPPRGRARREQQERLDALQRLCDQGTVTPAECTAKRNEILRGDP